jgi:hypothetical protein
MASKGADEQRIQRWLDWLRDGSEADKIVARRGLAHVFEQRGMLAEAIELLERNIDAGVRGAETLRWLSRLYQALDESTTLVAATQSPALGAPGPAEEEFRRTRPQAPRAPLAYLVVTVGLGITLGAGLWMLVPLPTP